MNEEAQLDWLMEEGGAAIRYRTANELRQDERKSALESYARELLQSRLTQRWLERLKPPRFRSPEGSIPAAGPELDLNAVHGSRPEALENVLGKLTDLGVGQGRQELDQRIQPYRQWLEAGSSRPGQPVFGLFARALIAAFLARAGYMDDPAVGSVLQHRLNRVYEFTRRGDYAIYSRPAVHVRGSRLIKRDLTAGGDIALPLIYDLIGWAAYLPRRGTAEEWAQAGTVIEYIFNPEYQQLPWEYGVISEGGSRYWSLGWSIHLPGYSGGGAGRTPRVSPAWLLDWLAAFPAARRQSWFQQQLDNLESLTTRRGTYLWPRAYLPEKSTGYWVNGAYLGLEENRRGRQALELEATFRMLRLRRLSGH